MIRNRTQGALVAALCFAAGTIAGCATPANSYPEARTPIERTAEALDRVHGVADAVLPTLPDPIATRVRVGLALADAALTIARLDRDPVAREQALRQIAGDVAVIAVELARR